MLFFIVASYESIAYNHNLHNCIDTHSFKQSFSHFARSNTHRFLRSFSFRLPSFISGKQMSLLGNLGSPMKPELFPATNSVSFIARFSHLHSLLVFASDSSMLESLLDPIRCPEASRIFSYTSTVSSKLE
jgi:hypothetical protein